MSRAATRSSSSGAGTGQRSAGFPRPWVGCRPRAQLDAGNNVALPDAAAGWGTYAFQRSGSPVVFGVHIEAITATGARAEIAFKGKRLRRLSIPGSRFPSAVVFTARSGRGLVHVTESEPDAIALLALEHLGVADLHGGSVVAAHCAGGLATAVVGPGEAVMLWPQRDVNYAGQTAALKARKALEGSSGSPCADQLGRGWPGLGGSRVAARKG